ncbi:hypothetical protein [Desulfonatronospira sp. MSAO_Bac3]|nr:hypothetical protein [Desulfonatronospira sp. MSAO_Bac3]
MQQARVTGIKTAERLDLTPQWVRRIRVAGDSLKKAVQTLPRGVLTPAVITRQDMWEIKHHMLMHEKLRARPVPELCPGRIIKKYV